MGTREPPVLHTLPLMMFELRQIVKVQMGASLLCFPGFPRETGNEVSPRTSHIILQRLEGGLEADRER